MVLVYFFLINSMGFMCAVSSQHGLVDSSDAMGELHNDTRHLHAHAMGEGEEDDMTSSDISGLSTPHETIAHEIYKNVCKIIPALENPEILKPSRKILGYSRAYDEKFGVYDRLKTLASDFEGAFEGDNDAKSNVVLWLLRGSIKKVCTDFYERYAQDQPNGKELLKKHLKQLIGEYGHDFEYGNSAETVLGYLDAESAKW